MSAEDIKYFVDEGKSAKECALNFIDLTSELYSRIYYQEVITDPLIRVFEPWLLRFFGVDLGFVFFQGIYNGLTID